MRSSQLNSELWHNIVVARFPALHSADFRALWLGQVISAVGSQMQLAAIDWQIYDLTGSSLALGAMGLTRLVPIICLSLIGGAFADTVDRRRLLLVMQGVMTLIALLLGTVAIESHGHMPVVLIYILTALSAAAIAFDNPARHALVPVLVPREDLPNAFALMTTGFQVSTVAGPALAGFVIARFGPGVAYMLNALSFLAVLYALLRLRYRPEKVMGQPAPRISFAALGDGLRFIRNTPILMATMGLDALAGFFASANALLPIFAKDILHVGPQGYGWLVAFPAIGALVAGAVMTVLPPIVRQGQGILYAILVYALATVGFGLSKEYALSAVFLALTGAADTVSVIMRQTIRNLVTPDSLRGRMVAVNMIFVRGGPQLGELEAGVVAKFFGPVVSVVSGGLACVLATLWVLGASRTLRDYRHDPQAAPDKV